MALFLAFLGLYLLTASGHFYAVDEETVFRVTESIVERHTFALPEAWGMVGNPVVPGGPLYAQYTPGQSLAALPLYLVGKALTPLFAPGDAGYVIRFCVALLGAFVTAATVAVLYRLARALGYGGGAALGLAAIYGLATVAWPHGRTFFSEPLTALCLLLAFYWLRVGSAVEGTAWVAPPAPQFWGGKDGRRTVAAAPPAGTGAGEPRSPQDWGAGGATHASNTAASPAATPHSALSTQHSALPLVLSGLAAVAAIVVKPQAAIALPVLWLYLAARALGGARGRGRRLRALVRAGLAWGLGLALGALPFAAFNAAIYGGPLSTGYGAAGAPDFLTTPFLTGLYGLTLSGGKGLLWYAPPVALAIAGWWPFCRRHRAEALACAGLLAIHLAFYSRVSYWHGDGAWGPRYLVIALPFAILPAVPLLDGLRARRLRLVAVGAIVAAGIAVQGLGMLVNFDWYILRSDEGARHFAPAASPILAHARILGERATEWRVRAAPPPGTLLLRDGLAYAEGADSDLFPRWTTGAATLMLYPDGPEPPLVKLTFFDHRPSARPDEHPAILLDGVPLADGAIEWRDITGNGEGWIAQFRVPAGDAARPTILTLQSPTWNPKLAGHGDRDETVGLFLHNVEAWQAGRPLAVREALAMERMPDTPRQRFWWFNDDALRHHATDLWVTYAATAGFGPARTATWIAAYTAVAAAPLLAGLALGRGALPTGWWRIRTTTRTRRRPKGKTRPRQLAGPR